MPDSPTLLDLFAEDIGHASQLLQLVDEEFQALERRELPVLQQLLGAKQPLMQQLERNGRARAEILREAGVSAVDLGAVVIREAVQRAGIAAED
ncbi:flagellar export chaperone FlgN, partial [Pseudomonas aeruginosa]|uniref:flagellar export chaperone FlgN n=1 Tax=Pseudomonas aeruginosa TaxID=287 RepID=UPI003749AB81